MISCQIAELKACLAFKEQGGGGEAKVAGIERDFDWDSVESVYIQDGKIGISLIKQRRNGSSYIIVVFCLCDKSNISEKIISKKNRNVPLGFCFYKKSLSLGRYVHTQIPRDAVLCCLGFTFKYSG